MADVNRGNRPLSPHISIYRPQLNSITSILSRITGAALNVTFIAIVVWLLAAAWSAPALDAVNAVLASKLGLIFWTASLWAFWYHFCAGLRHLLWDTGAGFDLKFVDASGWVVIVASFLLTAATLFII